MPTLTFYPDATAIDGMVEDDRHSATGPAIWSLKRVAGGNDANDTDDNYRVAEYHSWTSTNDWQILRRAIFLFDTSSLPDNAANISAVLSLYGFFKGQSHPTIPKPDVNIYASAPASNTALIGGDFDSLGSTPFCDTPISYDDWSESGYNDFTLNAAGIAAINKTGISKFGARNAQYDADGATPAWVSNHQAQLNAYSSRRGDGFKPKLVVSYEVAPVVLTVTTQDCTDTIAGKSTGRGTLTNKGDSAVTQHGHCWSTSTDPTTADSKTQNGGAPNLGQFKSDITGLTPGTLYYVRAYATNSQSTAYGVNVTITTPSTIGRRYWWVEKDEFHFFGEDGVEYKREGVAVAGDSALLAHLMR